VNSVKQQRLLVRYSKKALSEGSTIMELRNQGTRNQMGTAEGSVSTGVDTAQIFLNDSTRDNPQWHTLGSANQEIGGYPRTINPLL
tara:strand:- start:803 stop:1060 length:258 start_codon:yes stop_codon:yes gene_type:complete